jgi:Na+-transporting NADH:ubiquinone oxidoreductase subunit NqrB
VKNMTETTYGNDGSSGTMTDSQRRVRPVRLAYAAAVWVGLVVVALLNATVREVVLAPVVGDYAGHVLSTVTLLAALAVVAYVYFGRYAGHSTRELVVIGLLWTVLTVLFEFGFGHYVMGTAWSVLLADYNLLAGRVWVFVPLAMAVYPYLFGRMRE